MMSEGKCCSMTCPTQSIFNPNVTVSFACLRCKAHD